MLTSLPSNESVERGKTISSITSKLPKAERSVWQGTISKLVWALPKSASIDFLFALVQLSRNLSRETPTNWIHNYLGFLAQKNVDVNSQVSLEDALQLYREKRAVQLQEAIDYDKAFIRVLFTELASLHPPKMRLPEFAGYLVTSIGAQKLELLINNFKPNKTELFSLTSFGGEQSKLLVSFDQTRVQPADVIWALAFQGLCDYPLGRGDLAGFERAIKYSFVLDLVPVAKLKSGEITRFLK